MSASVSPVTFLVRQRATLGNKYLEAMRQDVIRCVSYRAFSRAWAFRPTMAIPRSYAVTKSLTVLALRART